MTDPTELNNSRQTEQIDMTHIDIAIIARALAAQSNPCDICDYKINPLFGVEYNGVSFCSMTIKTIMLPINNIMPEYASTASAYIKDHPILDDGTYSACLQGHPDESP